MLTAFLADAKSTIKARTNRDETGATAVVTSTSPSTVSKEF